MPHKHKRKRGVDEAEFDLPPTLAARPLPVGNRKQGRASESEPVKSEPVKKQRKGHGKENDAPRAFRRLMAIVRGENIRSGLDDGNGDSKKTTRVKGADEALRIRPGEDLRSFSSRVDTSLPVSGLSRKIKAKDGKDEFGIKVHRTQKERKMHKLYDQWREEERKIQERREEELEKIAEQDLENDAAGILTSKAFADENKEFSGKKRKKRKGKGCGGGGGGSDDEDPWSVLRKKRAEGRIGLHDVAQAPPELHKKTPKLLQVGGAGVDVDNVPKAVGSLHRREELQTERNGVIESYRKIRDLEQAKLDKPKKQMSRTSFYDSHGPESV